MCADLIEKLADSAEDMPAEMKAIHAQLEGYRCGCLAHVASGSRQAGSARLKAIHAQLGGTGAVLGGMVLAAASRQAGNHAQFDGNAQFDGDPRAAGGVNVSRLCTTTWLAGWLASCMHAG